MGVEGLWWFQTTSVQQLGVFSAGGVVVLETGRVLGGDSAYSYVGDYEAKVGEITANVRVCQYTPMEDVVNVFGMQGPVDYMAELRGTIHDRVIVGEMRPAGMPQMTLPIEMRFIERLPG